MLIIEMVSLALVLAVGFAEGYRVQHGVHNWTIFATGVVIGGLLSFTFHIVGMALMYTASELKRVMTNQVPPQGK